MTIREQALEFATRAHAGQKRRDGKDYITHPIAVAEIALNLASEYGITEQQYLDEIYVIAILHDVYEDTDTSLRDISNTFGFYFASCIELLSRTKGVTYFDYIMHVVDDNYDKLPMLVKLADLTHNLSDLQEGSMKDKYRFAQYIVKQNLK